MNNYPSYLVFVCPNCIAIRHFKAKGNNTYYCPVCKLEILYSNGIITKVGISSKGLSKTPPEPFYKIPLYIAKKRIRSNNPKITNHSKVKGIARNPYDPKI